MTADRLRAAADWLQSEADWVRTLGLSWQREAAMAALLRAVADEDVCNCDPAWTERGMHSGLCVPEQVLPHIKAAALAVAAVILRDTDG